MELTPTHHYVLWCAYDALALASLLSGVDEVIGSGEHFTIVPPLPAEDVQRVTVELLDAGGIRMARLDLDSDESRRLTDDEARRVLDDPATWRVQTGEDRRISPADAHEIVLTDVGEKLFEQAHELFGAEIERTAALARERSAEFRRRHPDFVEKNEQYMDAMTRWIEGGGPQPERPRFD